MGRERVRHSHVWYTVGSWSFFKIGLLTDHFLHIFSSEKISTTRKTSSFPDPRSPSLYATWTLSTASVSSQGSISEGEPRQSRPFKSIFVPTAIVNPVRSAAGPGTSRQGSLRKGRSSMRKSKWWRGRQSTFLRNRGLSFKTSLCEGCFTSHKACIVVLDEARPTQGHCPPVTSYLHVD